MVFGLASNLHFAVGFYLIAFSDYLLCLFAIAEWQTKYFYYYTAVALKLNQNIN